MKIRAITANEIEAFAMIKNSKSRLKQTLLNMWKDNESYPEWCFVVEKDEKFIARVAYWAFTSSPNEIKILGLLLPWDDDSLSIGVELLQESLKQMQAKGATDVEVHIYSDSTTFLEKRVELLKQVGFELMQEKQNYISEQINETIIIPNRLVFRTLAEMSNEIFTDAIKRVTVGTLDKADSLELKNLGAEKAALNYFNILKDIDYRPNWWYLAYDSDGALVGLVVPQKFSKKEGAINYIGVVPDYRGQGYVHDLLAKGTSILKNDGIEHVIAEIDVNNIPLENALSRAGYKKRQTMWIYGMKLKKQMAYEI